MSLEERLGDLDGRIAQLTGAVVALTAAFTANPTKTASKKTTAETAGATAQPTANLTSPAVTQTPVVNAVATSAASVAVAATQPTVATIDAETLGKSLIALCDPTNGPIGRAKAIEILAKHGAKDFAGLKVEIYAQAKADFDAAFAALKAPATGTGGLI